MYAYIITEYDFQKLLRFKTVLSHYVCDSEQCSNE